VSRSEYRKAQIRSMQMARISTDNAGRRDSNTYFNVILTSWGEDTGDESDLDIAPKPPLMVAMFPFVSPRCRGVDASGGGGDTYAALSLRKSDMSSALKVRPHTREKKKPYKSIIDTLKRCSVLNRFRGFKIGFRMRQMPEGGLESFKLLQDRLKFRPLHSTLQL